MTVYNDIRSALETTLAAIPSIPDIQFQNKNYKPSTKTPFIKCTFFPTSRRPSEVGSNPFNRYQGLFVVNVYTPDNRGIRENQNICNLVLDAFPAGTHDLTFNGQIVRTEFTEQLSSFESPPWFITPINVGWYAYDKS